LSGFTAIRDVTVALQSTLQNAVTALGATATTLRPADPGTVAGPTVNIYLYQVTPNAALRNADLPTRRPGGSVMQKPQAALDLHYLLSFYDQANELTAQIVLGAVVGTLHGKPVVTVPGVGPVRFTPVAFNLEELSKLWSMLFQIKYALSVAYQGSLVLIEDDEKPVDALPVRERQIHVMPFHRPVIQSITTTAGSGAPILLSSTIVLLGQSLQGEVTTVRLGDAEVTPPPGAVTDASITLPLSLFAAGTLRAGPLGTQVVQLVNMGNPPTPHRGVESDVVPFVLRPVIAKKANNVDYDITVAAGTVTVKLVPGVGAGQRVLMFLSQLAADAPVSFVAGTPPAAATATLTFSTAGIAAGTYLIRIQVDGAESPLDVDATGHFTGPTVTLP